MANLSYYIGAAGVDSSERLLAKRVGVVFEVPMLMAAFWIALNWWAEHRGLVSIVQVRVYDFFLWMLFILETGILSLLVTDTRRYLRYNWLNVIIILLGLPLLLGLDVNVGALRLLRLLIVFSLFMHIGSRVRKMLSRNELGTTLLASAIVIVMAGLMMAAIDPAIKSPMDGIWWAWVTVTTVGYGDLVPVSPLGKVLASLVMLMGIGLFSMITASFAAFFISQKEEVILDEEKELYRRVAEMDDRLERLECKLDEFLSRENPDGTNGKG